MDNTIVAFKLLSLNIIQHGLNIFPTKDAIYCLSCFVFHNLKGVVGQNIFTVGGFRSLTDSLMLYIENDIASTYCSDSIIDDF